MPPKPGERFWYCATATYAAVASEAISERDYRPSVRVIRLGGPEGIRVDPPIYFRAEVDELGCGPDRLQVRMGRAVRQVAIGEGEPAVEASGTFAPRSKGEQRGLLRPDRIYRLPNDTFALAFLRASRSDGPSSSEEVVALFVLGTAEEQLVFARHWRLETLD